MFVLLSDHWEVQSILLCSIPAFGSTCKGQKITQVAEVKLMQLIKSRKVVFICIVSALTVGSDKNSWGSFTFDCANALRWRSPKSAIAGSVLAWICDYATVFSVSLFGSAKWSYWVGPLIDIFAVLYLLCSFRRENSLLWNLRFACQLC